MNPFPFFFSASWMKGWEAFYGQHREGEIQRLNQPIGVWYQFLSSFLTIMKDCVQHRGVTNPNRHGHHDSLLQDSINGGKCLMRTNGSRADRWPSYRNHKRKSARARNASGQLGLGFLTETPFPFFSHFYFFFFQERNDSWEASKREFRNYKTPLRKFKDYDMTPELLKVIIGPSSFKYCKLKILMEIKKAYFHKT